MLGIADAGTAKETYIHPLFHQSATLKRVCRATYQAETYQMQLGVEHVDVLRAAVADMCGKLDRDDWERSASSFCKNVWLTDCRSRKTSRGRQCRRREATGRPSSGCGPVDRYGYHAGGSDD